MVKNPSLLPKNIGNLKRHFEKELSKVNKKLKCIEKQRRELELEKVTLEDGIGWCQSIYKISTRSQI